MTQQNGKPLEPYIGLVPYSEEDALFFFGREKLQKIIINNLTTSRLTILYGPSGVGKSSILQAGVAYNLQQATKQNLEEDGTPEFATVVFKSWRDNPLDNLKQQVEKDVKKVLEDSAPEPIAQSPEFDQCIQAWTEYLGGEQGNGELFIILDQFEDYFLYHPQEDGERTFAIEFPRAVNRSDLKVNFLISIREESLATLDRFKGRIPGLFRNYLRVKHLDREAARAAIVKPIEKYNELLQSKKSNEQLIEIESALVEKVLDLDGVMKDRGTSGETGQGKIENSQEKGIEAPYLQMVMTRLWQEEMKVGSHCLRVETLEKLGNAATIIQDYLKQKMDALPESEQDAAAKVFYHLVTPSGTKIAYSVNDLAEYTRLALDNLKPMLKQLEQFRILRPVELPHQPDMESYEIFHDALAPAILEWRREYLEEAKKAAEKAREEAERERKAAEKAREEAREEAERERKAAEKAREEAERARKRRQQMLSGLGIFLGIAGAAIVWQGLRLQKAELATDLRAAEKKDSQPDMLWAAMQAGQQFQSNCGQHIPFRLLPKSDCDDAASKLAFVLAQSLGIWQQSPVWSVSFSPDGKTLATASADNTARLWDLQGKQLQKFPHKVAVWDVSFSPDGETLATASADKTARLWNLQGIQLKEFSHQDAVLSVSFSPDGKTLVTASADKTARLWNLQGKKQPKELKGHQDAILSVSFSPDGETLATASADKTARLWNLQGIQLKEFKDRKADVQSVSFSPDGQSLVTGSADGTADLWDLQGKQLKELKGHQGHVWDVNFSPDGKTLATASQDYTVRLWDLQGKELRKFEGYQDAVRSVSFSPDGKILATGSRDGKVILQRLDENPYESLKSLLAAGCQRLKQTQPQEAVPICSQFN